MDVLILFIVYKNNNTSNETIPLEINQIQNELVENMNKFIKKQIYFCDNFENIKDEDWILLKKVIKKNIKNLLTIIM